MRLHRYGIQPNMGPTGEVTHITVWYENRDDMTGDIMNGNFIASVDDFVRIQNKEIAVEDIIKQKITKMLDLNADADTELAIQAVKDQVLEVELKTEKAVEAQAEGIREEMETAIGAVVEEAKTQAQEAVGEQVTQLGAEIEKATAAVAEIATLKSAIRKLLPITEMTPDEIAELVALYEPWKVDETLEVGDIRSYEGKLWEVIQQHTTQDDWRPPSVPALFKEVAPAQTEEGDEIVPEWKQPTGGHDAYNVGDKVLFDGKVYESVIDANTWSPSDYPQGWREVTE